MRSLRCHHCGREFQGWNDPRYPVRFCGRKCQSDWQRRNRPKCAVCGQLVKASDDTYCSHECANIGRRGKRVKVGSPEYERKRADILARRRRDYEADPTKQAARNLARKHTPVEPCEVAGCGKPGDRHHDDYSKPLDVRYLCRSHHIAHHKRLGRAA